MQGIPRGSHVISWCHVTETYFAYCILVWFLLIFSMLNFYTVIFFIKFYLGGGGNFLWGGGGIANILYIVYYGRMFANNLNVDF